MKAYQFLENTFKDILTIQQILCMLEWDKDVIMPVGSIDAKIEHTSYLIKLAHDKICSPIIKEKINEAELEKNSLDNWQKANLLEMKRMFDDYNSVDSKLLQEYSSLCKECEVVWRSAKNNKSFKEILPYFEKLVLCAQNIALAKGDYFKTPPYQALVNEFDPGRSLKEIDLVFTTLKQFLPEFIQKVRKNQCSKPALNAHFPINLQQQLGVEIMRDLGFNFKRGRIDTSSHPFCGGITQDIRLTTRYDEHDVFVALQGIIHETGHSLYESNLPKKYLYQPVGENLGMAIHESQSLLTEMQIARSDEFIDYLAPKLSKYFSSSKQQFNKDQISKYLRYVEPSFIRVNADEVTYPLHVIMRYELEQKLISGDLQAKDLPFAWNEKFQKLLGLTPPDDALGCLQDIHWYCGMFGYFPSYTLGAVTAAQIMHSLKIALPQANDYIRKGEFKPIYDWLKNNIYEKGRLFSADELLVNTTGESLNPQYFIEYLKSRYQIQ